MLYLSDWLVIAFYLLFMLALGPVFKSFSRNASDFFRGGGNMAWWIAASMFMTGFSAGKSVDNTSDAYVLPWLETVRKIAPRQVMIYTIDRETPDHDLCKASPEQLDRIAALIREAGIDVSVSY